jgi:hypothetical protein
VGRHSAPTEDDEEDVVAVVVEPTVPTGRHARPAATQAEPAAEAEPRAEVDDEPTYFQPEPRAEVDDEPTHRIPQIEAALVAEDDQAATHPTDPLPPAAGIPADAAQAPAPVPAAEAATPEPIAPEPLEATAEASATEAAPVRNKRVGKGSHSTAADLALLRDHSEVRARCIAAVVVPFVLYTALLLAIGSMDVYVIWIWIPTVSAGVLAGGFLDAAHRRYDTPADPPLPDRQTG